MAKRRCFCLEEKRETQARYQEKKMDKGMVEIILGRFI